MSLSMQLVINGEVRTLDGLRTVADLVAYLDLKPPRVAVELNARLVRRADYPSTPLQENDQVEIVTLVGGG